MTTRVVTPDAGGLDEAIALLRAGRVVALPTETVYGLAADARRDDAVAAIFEAKGRPGHNPLIVHVASINDAQNLIDLDERAHTLATRFWPGPLTIIGKQKPHNGIAKSVSAGLDTLAVRVPAHPLFRMILEACDFPIAAPSANASGTLSATSPQIVMQGLAGRIPMVLAGGLTDKGLESTIIDLSGPDAVLLRHGALAREDIEDAIGPVTDGTAPSETPRSPGQLLRHYAPRATLRLNAVDVADDEALLAFGSLQFMGVKGGGFAKDLPPTRLKNLSEIGDLDEAARHLFAHLYALDQAGAKKIAVMNIPQSGIGAAINDRLRRACQAQQKV